MKYNSFYQVKDNSWNCGDPCPVAQVSITEASQATLIVM
jgi:hypothetical protein